MSYKDPGSRDPLSHNYFHFNYLINTFFITFLSSNQILGLPPFRFNCFGIIAWRLAFLPSCWLVHQTLIYLVHTMLRQSRGTMQDSSSFKAVESNFTSTDNPTSGLTLLPNICWPDIQLARCWDHFSDNYN